MMPVVVFDRVTGAEVTIGVRLGDAGQIYGAFPDPPGDLAIDLVTLLSISVSKLAWGT
jgi:hypothetical protein